MDSSDNLPVPRGRDLVHAPGRSAAGVDRRHGRGRHYEAAVAVDPIEVPFDQIGSMKVAEPSGVRTAVLVVSLLAVAYVFAAVAAIPSMRFGD